MMNMSHDTTEQSRDTTVDVAEAARRLGISEDAVRARIRRGKLRAEKVGALWYVHLSAGEATNVSYDATDDRATRHDADDGAPGPVGDVALIEHMRGEIAYLRAELAKRSDELAAERERADVLQREALERIEALTAIAGSGSLSSNDSEASGSPGSADADDGDATDVVVDPGAQRGVWARLARWWKG